MASDSWERQFISMWLMSYWYYRVEFNIMDLFVIDVFYCHCNYFNVYWLHVNVVLVSFLQFGHWFNCSSKSRTYEFFQLQMITNYTRRWFMINYRLISTTTSLFEKVYYAAPFRSHGTWFLMWSIKWGSLEWVRLWHRSNSCDNKSWTIDARIRLLQVYEWICLLMWDLVACRWIDLVVNWTSSSPN